MAAGEAAPGSTSRAASSEKSLAMMDWQRVEFWMMAWSAQVVQMASSIDLPPWLICIFMPTQAPMPKMKAATRAIVLRPLAKEKELASFSPQVGGRFAYRGRSCGVGLLEGAVVAIAVVGGMVVVGVWIEDDTPGLVRDVVGALLLAPSRFDVFCCVKVVRGMAVVVAVVVGIAAQRDSNVSDFQHFLAETV